MSYITSDRIVAALSDYRDLPERERANYRADDYVIVEPGSTMGDHYGFTVERFTPDSFLALKGVDLHISLIRSRVQGAGHFSALLSRMEQLGLRVHIVAPLRQMTAILERKGFKPHTVGTTFEDRRDVWTRGNKP